MRRVPVVVTGFALLVGGGATSCRDLSGFSTNADDSYQGSVVNADFVLTGVQPDVTMCVTLDADHLQDLPGALSTSDGRFRKTRLRPIPQIWHDPLSTLSFGEGRLKNLIYVATTEAPLAPPAAGATPLPGGEDVWAVVSLLQSGGVEVRLLRGAPAIAPPPSTDGGTVAREGNLFAIFELSRKEGLCSY